MIDHNLDPTPFGRAMRKTHFLFAPTYIPLNHGSFGTYPRYVQTRLHEMQGMAETRPDAFQFYEMPKLLNESRRAMAEYITLKDADEIVFVPNSSVGTNTVLRNLVFEENDVIVHLSTVYSAVEKTLSSLAETTPMTAVNIQVNYPVQDKFVIEQMRTAIRNANSHGKRVRLAIFDTISSVPGVRMPWEQLCEICREEKVMSFVDGAHGFGQIDINLDEARPDFFVSNLHKWLFVPRGCALLYVPKRNQHLIRTSLPTSHGFRPLEVPGHKKISNPLAGSTATPFVGLFEFVATVDVSPYLCVVAALEFRRLACGGEGRIKAYCEELARKAGAMAANEFGTNIIEDEANSLTRCAMTNVRLPLQLGDSPGQITRDSVPSAINWLKKHLLEEFDTFALIFAHADALWVRLSAQIYLELEDFGHGIRALQELCTRLPTVLVET